MGALRLIPRSEWERRLREEHECQPDTEEEIPLATGEWWTTKHNFLFPVTCDADGFLRPEDWQRVLIHIARLRPMDWYR